MQQAVMLVLIAMFVSVAAWAAKGLAGWLEHKIPQTEQEKIKAEYERIEQEIATKKGIAYDIFVMVNDVYAALDGPAKLGMVEHLLVLSCDAMGLPLTDTEVQTIISTVYNEFCKDFGANFWGVTTTAVRTAPAPAKKDLAPAGIVKGNSVYQSDQVMP